MAGSVMRDLGHQSRRPGALVDDSHLAARLSESIVHAAALNSGMAKARLLGIPDCDGATNAWKTLEDFLRTHPTVLNAARAVATSPHDRQARHRLHRHLTKALATARKGRDPMWQRLASVPADGEGHARRGAALLTSSLLLLSIIGLVLATLTFQEQHRVVALKAFAVVVLSFLPGWLFLRFLVFRAASVWEEYVLNLHRLGIDKPQHLPRPPDNSIYFNCWWHSGGPQFEAASSIYRQKFEAYYGRGSAQPSSAVLPRLRIDSIVPLALATAVLSVGWVAVLWQDSVFRGELTLPWDLLRFAFLGSYVFILQMLIRRYFQADLKASAYLTSCVRVVTAAIAVLAVHRVDLVDALAPGEATANQEVAVAFVIGFLPLVGLQALQKFSAVALRLAVPTLRNDYPLSDLDGLNVWYEARLLEEGIEDMENLATANLVDVILHTRVPVGRLIDWIDQAILYLHLQPPERRGGRPKPTGDRAELRKLGIRTATALEDAFRLESDRTGGSLAHSISPERDKQLVEGLRWHLNGKHPGIGASATEAILKTLSSAPNLKHVRAWKRDWRQRPEEAKISQSSRAIGNGGVRSQDGSTAANDNLRAPSNGK